MSFINNTSYLDVTTCDEVVTASSNQVNFEVVELTIVKTTSCPWTVTGGTITYCTTITNPSLDMDLLGAVFSDVLDNRLSYVVDSFTLNGTPETPTINGQRIEFTLDILADSVTTICFQVLVGPAATP